MQDGTYNMALAASLNMDIRAAKERIAALEQLVREYRLLLRDWDEPRSTQRKQTPLNSDYDTRYLAAEAQYKALLEQEIK